MTPQHALQFPQLIKSAAMRASHMSGALQWFAQQFDASEQYSKVFFELVQAVCSAAQSENKSVHFVAVGKSGGISQVAVAMLSSVGIRARYLHPTEALHGDLGAVGWCDVIIFVSRDGRSAELLQIISKFTDRNCKTFALTARPQSPLAQACQTVLLLPPVEENCPLNQCPLTSSVTSLAFCQLLVAATVEFRGYDLESYARNHPGGAIGKRIFVKVDDLMIRDQNLGVVTLNSSFQHCVSVMTQCGLGALIVCESLTNTKLLGLISERDLRVAMEKWQAQVFEKSASDFMNNKPFTVLHGSLAIEALRIMENRPRPISVLPVVNDAGNALGMIRIHDLIASGITLE